MEDYQLPDVGSILFGSLMALSSAQVAFMGSVIEAVLA